MTPSFGCGGSPVNAMAEFALLKTFKGLFEGKQYNHRDSSLGDLVASQLYEDLVTLNKSKLLTERVHKHECVVNAKNLAIGEKNASRGWYFWGARPHGSGSHSAWRSRGARSGREYSNWRRDEDSCESHDQTDRPRDWRSYSASRAVQENGWQSDHGCFRWNQSRLRIYFLRGRTTLPNRWKQIQTSNS
jgi:hypothetical protein